MDQRLTCLTCDHAFLLFQIITLQLDSFYQNKQTYLYSELHLHC